MPRKKKKRTYITRKIREKVWDLKRNDPSLSTRDIARKVKINQSTVVRILNSDAKVMLSDAKVMLKTLENIDQQVVQIIQKEAKKKQLTESNYLLSLINNKPNYSAGTTNIEIESNLAKRLELLKKQSQVRDISSVIAMLFTLYERFSEMREEIS